MMAIYYWDFISEVEWLIRDEIRTKFPASWDENHITFSLCDALTKKYKGGCEIAGLERPFKIKWDARKLRGTVEQRYGDLGILVNLRTWENEEIEGVGVLEAKARAPSSNSFSAMRAKQTAKISRLSAASRLLLYDYAQIVGFEDNLSLWSDERVLRRYYDFHHAGLIPYSHAATLPLAIGKAIGSNTTSLYKFSIPLSLQMIARYFRGFDLETSSQKVNEIKGSMKKTGGTGHLILVGISTSGAQPVLPTVNESMYDRLPTA
jgi:hypothetical protein